MTYATLLASFDQDWPSDRVNVTVPLGRLGEVVCHTLFADIISTRLIHCPIIMWIARNSNTAIARTASRLTRHAPDIAI